MAVVLGISVGTRNVGLAVVRLRRLSDCSIRTFAGAWTPAKCAFICSVIEAVIRQYGITDISLKLPPVTHMSPNIQALITGIEGLGVPVHYSTIEDIMRLYSDKKRAGKQVMIAAIISKYPHLKKRWQGGTRSKLYNAKLFEAIASAELALKR